MVFAGQAMAQDRVLTKNNMGQPAFLWIKSELSPETTWGRYAVDPGPGTLVPLAGPDSFELVTEDRDGVEWRKPNAVPIRELMRTKKLTELTLDGKRVSETRAFTEWNPWAGRWEQRRQTVSKRVAVVYILKFADGTTEQQDAPQTGRRPAPARQRPFFIRPQTMQWQGAMPGCGCDPWGW